MRGMHAAAVAGAVVMIAAAVSAVIPLRDVRAEAPAGASAAEPARA